MEANGGWAATPHDEHPLASTAHLFVRAQTGDGAARREILLRYREPLAHFLRGRLAPSARGELETADIVQEVLASALGQLERIEYRDLGSFWCYLRRIGINRILAVERKRGVRPAEGHDSGVLDAAADDSGDGPLAVMQHKEAGAAFDAALERIPEPARGALLLRLELGLPYGTIASECGYSSADAARMAIGRSLAHLSQELAAFEP